jgi:hypothetical protein
MNLIAAVLIFLSALFPYEHVEVRGEQAVTYEKPIMMQKVEREDLVDFVRDVFGAREELYGAYIDIDTFLKLAFLPVEHVDKMPDIFAIYYKKPSSYKDERELKLKLFKILSIKEEYIDYINGKTDYITDDIEPEKPVNIGTIYEDDDRTIDLEMFKTTFENQDAAYYVLQFDLSYSYQDMGFYTSFITKMYDIKDLRKVSSDVITKLKAVKIQK